MNWEVESELIITTIRLIGFDGGGSPSGLGPGGSGHRPHAKRGVDDRSPKFEKLPLFFQKH